MRGLLDSARGSILLPLPIVLVIFTLVPSPTFDSTSTVSINASIKENPIPDRSSSGFVVNIGSIAFSTFAIPFPRSDISTVKSWFSILQCIFTFSTLCSYPWIIAFVTASDTAVFTSATSSTVGLSCVKNDATDTLANPSFSDLLSKRISISLFCVLLASITFPPHKSA